MYIGQDLQVAFSSYLNIDDISGSFNSVTTSFALTVNGSTPVPLPINSQQCLISVGGIIQRPDDTGTEGFRLSGSNIVFSSAPNTGEDFFGTILAGADYINAGVNFPDGQSSAPSITFDQDLDTGFFRSSSGAVSFSSNGVNTATLGSNSFIAPSFIPTSSSVPSNGVFLPAANSVAIATNGTQQATVDSSGRLGIGTSTPGEKLTVDGNISLIATSPIVKGGFNLNLEAPNNIEIIADNDSSGTGYIDFRTQSSSKVRIANSGAVGIGDTDFDALLSIKGAADFNTTPHLRLKDGTDTREAWIANNAGDLQLANGGNDNTPHCFVKLLDGNQIQLGTSNTERFRVGSSGQLGIGGGTYGTSGQVLTSNGASAAPSWQNAGGSTGTLKAWVNFNGTGTVAIRASGNVSSITDNGTGDYTVNFTTALADANYAIGQAAEDPTNSEGYAFVGLPNAGLRTTTQCRFKVTRLNVGPADSPAVCIAIFR